MIKHNKKRNTAFIYEALVREVVKQSIEKNEAKRDIAIAIIKEAFAASSELRKELILYKTLLETKNLNEKIAEKLLTEVIKQHKTIDQKQLFKEQSFAISKINKKICKSVFSNFVPNYKSLATISQIFGSVDSPKAKVLLESRLIDDMTKKKKYANNAPLQTSLVINTFTKRFNETYDDLLHEQKTLLSKFVSSFEDGGTEFKFYLNEEIQRLKEAVQSSFDLEEAKEDTKLKAMLTEVSGVLNDFKNREVDRQLLLKVMEIQNLAKELQS